MAKQPDHKPTDEKRIKVSSLKSFGITDLEIAAHIGITHETLRKHYAHELDTAIVSANAAVAGKLFKKCIHDEDLTAIIFWLKTRARWRTEDNKAALQQSDEVLREVKEVREKLAEKYKKDY